MRQTMFSIRIQQHQKEVELLEQLLNETRPIRIVEVGSGFGSLSTYFATWAFMTDANFLTVDITDKRLHDGARRLLERLGAYRVNEDCFSDSFKCRFKKFIGDGIAFILCDGGNKTKEARTFVTMLKPGDVLALHDFGTEVNSADFAQDWERENDLESVMRQELQHHNCRIRAWRKKTKEPTDASQGTSGDRC